MRIFRGIEYLSLDELAEEMGMTRNSARERAKQRGIPGLKVGAKRYYTRQEADVIVLGKARLSRTERSDDNYARANLQQSLENCKTYAQGIVSREMRQTVVDVLEEVIRKVQDIFSAEKDNE